MQALSPTGMKETNPTAPSKEASPYLSIAGKIVDMVIADRLTPTITKQNLSESQCKFRTNTVDKIFVLRQLQLECW